MHVSKINLKENWTSVFSQKLETRVFANMLCWHVQLTTFLLTSCELPFALLVAYETSTSMLFFPPAPGWWIRAGPIFPFLQEPPYLISVRALLTLSQDGAALVLAFSPLGAIVAQPLISQLLHAPNCKVHVPNQIFLFSSDPSCFLLLCALNVPLPFLFSRRS